jgi:N-acetyl-anhydromuramyl-L-alanine amidase AmpD
MTIQKNLVPVSKYPLKCPNAMTAVGICVHNTANDASAKGEISYMVGNSLQTSFHLAVDDIEVWQGLPLDRNGWHAGDGASGEGNRKYIGIEICYSKTGGSRFTKAEQNAAELIAQLLKERNWGIERVKKHQDFSGKYCPHRTLDMGWDRFLNIIKTNMGEQPMPTELQIYLGVATDTEAFAKLREHLGEKDSKCDWGNPADGRGGHLGSERRKVATLTNDKTVLIQANQTLTNTNIRLSQDLATCLAQPPAPPINDTLNGRQEIRSVEKLADGTVTKIVETETKNFTV